MKITHISFKEVGEALDIQDADEDCKLTPAKEQNTLMIWQSQIESKDKKEIILPVLVASVLILSLTLIGVLAQDWNIVLNIVKIITEIIT